MTGSRTGVDGPHPQYVLTIVDSERVWLVTLEADDVETPPQTFHFVDARVPLKETVYQRYEDADLVAVKQDVSLVSRYNRAQYGWLWMPALAAVVTATNMAPAPKESR